MSTQDTEQELSRRNPVAVYGNRLRSGLADKLTSGPEAERLQWEQRIAQYVVAFAEQLDQRWPSCRTHPYSTSSGFRNWVSALTVDALLGDPD